MCRRESASNLSPVRRLREQDCDRVAEIWLEGSKDAHAFKPSEFWEARLDKMKGIFRKADGWVYEVDGTVVGFIVLRRYGGGGTTGGIGAFWPGEATNIDDFFVLRDYRRRGIGSALMQRAQRDHACLTLNVYVKNTKAIERYRQYGYVQSSPHYPEPETQEDKMWMRWTKE